MDKRHLGTALEVSAIGLGCRGLSANAVQPGHAVLTVTGARGSGHESYR
jgi:aryl-alcohol dehydrogenase-like predicted oxidoreductase